MRFFVLIFFLLAPLVSAIDLYDEVFCGRRTCYSVLNLTKDATTDEIRKVYRRMQREYHPDKIRNSVKPREFLEEQFHLIRTAYEVLKDPVKREEYDYLLMNPVAMHHYWVTNRTGHTLKKPLHFKIGAPFVLAGLLVLISGAQYYVSNMQYDQKIDRQLRSPDVFQFYLQQAKAKAISVPADPSSSLAILKAEFGDFIAENIFVARFRITDTLLFQVFMLPLTLFQLVSFLLAWLYRRKVAKSAYTKQDREHLTRKALKVSSRVWNSLSPQRKNELTALDLWIPENIKKYRNPGATALSSSAPKKGPVSSRR